jgi:hypothetical protein
MLLLSFSDERVNAIGRATDLFRGAHATVLKDPTAVQLVILAAFNRIILSFCVEPTELEGPGLHWQFTSPRRGKRRSGIIRGDTYISARNVRGFQQFHIRLEERRTDCPNCARLCRGTVPSLCVYRIGSPSPRSRLRTGQQVIVLRATVVINTPKV